MVYQRNFQVVGGGVLGLSTARALLKSGSSVTILEIGCIGRELSWAGSGKHNSGLARCYVFQALNNRIA